MAEQTGYCLLVLGGEIRDMALFRRRLDDAALVLVADSGARHMLRLGIMPERVFGDLDSLTREEIATLEAGGCAFTRFAEEKNDTDCAIVLREALRLGYKDILIWGALGGGRPDHSFANIALLQMPRLAEYRSLYGSQEEDLPRVVIEDWGMRMFIPKRGQWIEGGKGQYISFFALTPEVDGFAQKGLKYQPEGGRFTSAYPLGVSNAFTEDFAWVDWDRGLLLCMQVDPEAYGAASPT